MKRKKRTPAVTIIVTILLAAILGGLVWWGVYLILNRVTFVSLSAVLTEYETDNTSVVVDDNPITLDDKVKIENEVFYFPLDFINENITQYFYWDEKEQVLTYTTLEKVYKIKPNENTCFVNNEVYKLEKPIKIFDDTLYIPSTFLLSHFNIELVYDSKLNVTILDHKENMKMIGKIDVDKTYLRTNIKDTHLVYTELTKNEEVVLFEKENGYYKARNSQGIVGYVKEKDIGDIRKILPKKSEEVKVAIQGNRKIEGKINMVWHQVTNSVANSRYRQSFNNVSEGLDVISPTWFHLLPNGDVASIADKWYVKWAHENGYQVWALFDNRFDSKLTHEVLSSTSKRQKVIDHIVALAKTYNLDGINIDFESIAKQDGVHFVQFMRELAPVLKDEGLVLSVDCYVPSAYTAHYNRAELAKVVDYIIIMAYDEHWSTCPESGSNASIGFVKKGIVNTLKEVPKEKILLGIAYYNRLWKEQVVDGEIKPKSSAFSMDTATKFIENNNIELKWLDDLGQYYGEFKEDDITYKFWVEEERSIEEKLKLMEEYDLAGISGWKKGMEKDIIWPLLNKYLKK